WVACTLESKELLALCLRKLRGLSKVRLVDAGFVWTEPHSRRVRVRLVVQKEVLAGAIVQQQFEVEFVVSTQQCDACARVMAKDTWTAVVQVRQKVDHKRTFFYLEQLLLKHRAHRETVNIKSVRDGIDFYFSQRNHAIKMVEFLQAAVPVRYQASSQLISSDIQAGTAKYKYTYSVELVPVCKDDLVCLPQKVARSLGSIAPLLLVSRIGNAVHVLDPNTLASGELTVTAFWRQPFYAMCSAREQREFVVLDVQPCGPVKGKHVLADIEVARVSDFGRNDTTYFARSHLGAILRPGDFAFGYDLSRSNVNNDDFERLDRGDIPDVILVKKSYHNRRKKAKARNWRLKTLATDDDDGGVAAVAGMRRQELERAEADFEMFLRDIEEDPELRATINLYKSEQAQPAVRLARDADEAQEDFPEIKLEELLDEMSL
ncbi:NMD3-domain-containing protein, partial [Ramicandelaber brevisporus]